MRFFHSKISSQGVRGKSVKVPSSKEDEWQVGETVRVISVDDIKMEVTEK